MILAALTLATLVPANLDAQGLQGGLNLSELFGGDVEQADTRRGIVAGGSLTLLTVGPISIVPQVYYAQKGAADTQLLVESPASYDQFGLEYLEVPVLARVGGRIPGAQWLGIYAQGGPAFAWNLDCSIEPGADGGATVSDGCGFGGPGGAEAAVKRAEQGLVLGGGVEFRVLDLGLVTLDGRMVRGLSRIGDPDVRNQATSLMIGYSFSGRRGPPGGM
jgi:hypothetical protein